MGRLGDDSELLIIWFLVAVWPLGQRIGLRKKYLIQETVCSVSKCLNPLFELFLCYLSFYGLLVI